MLGLLVISFRNECREVLEDGESRKPRFDTASSTRPYEARKRLRLGCQGMKKSGRWE